MGFALVLFALIAVGAAAVLTAKGSTVPPLTTGATNVTARRDTGPAFSGATNVPATREVNSPAPAPTSSGSIPSMLAEYEVENARLQTMRAEYAKAKDAYEKSRYLGQAALTNALQSVATTFRKRRDAQAATVRELAAKIQAEAQRQGVLVDFQGGVALG